MERQEDEELPQPQRREHAYSLGRILAISDGVFAFALTLLVVQFTIPTATAGSSLRSQLDAQLPSFVSYVISFAAVASTWYGHHETFKYIQRVDGRLIGLNFVSLLLIAFLPFPTAVLGRNQHEPLAAVAYAMTLVLSNVFAAATWWYAIDGRRLVSRDLPVGAVRLRFYRTVSGAVVFLVSIPIALWNPPAAEIVWIAFLVALFVFVRGTGENSGVGDPKSGLGRRGGSRSR